MTYQTRLYHWAIARLIPPVRWVIIGRCRNRSDADGHLQLLRQRLPHVRFEIVFDLAIAP
ncbi:hypothetical protein [Almyronema epifaneia]|uniref:Uncharacterized protein n=1 Tax=Almyronema epifaneia S1 TaxID=2991925 RepID=A0ABW6IBK0_9CYAN